MRRTLVGLALFTVTVVAQGACSDGSPTTTDLGSTSSTSGGACGAKGQPCCANAASACGDGLMCVDSTCSDPCGGLGQSCCGGVACTAAYTCAAGTCQCGGPGQICCEIPCPNGVGMCGRTCAGDLACGADTTCVTCGGYGQPCCDGACGGKMACASDQTCTYDKAELYVYFCPDYASSGCASPANFTMNGACSPIAGGAPQLGAWIPTGLTIETSRVYSLSACKAGSQPGSCGGCTSPKTVPMTKRFESSIVCVPAFSCNGIECAAPPCPGQAL